jgi:nucleotide-binding universal stress UspA family protein
LIVQDVPTQEQGYPRILLPFTFTRESRQKLAWALYLSERFNAKFYLLAEEIKDDFLRKGVNNNMAVASKLFEKHEIPYSIEYVKDTRNFAQEINEYASSIQADMIVLMSEEETELSEIFTAPQEQEIITNSHKIPVLTLNPIDNMQIMRKAMFQ